MRTTAILLHACLTAGLAGLALGCVGNEDAAQPQQETRFGATAYEQNLDAMLANQGTDQVEVFVRLAVPQSASELHDLLAAEGSPEIVSFNAIGATDSATMQIGTTPFTGKMSDDALNEAILSYWIVKYGTSGELGSQIEQAALAGNAFSVEEFTGVGKADEIRAWWHTNSAQVEAVISTPSL